MHSQQKNIVASKIHFLRTCVLNLELTLVSFFYLDDMSSNDPLNMSSIQEMQVKRKSVVTNVCEEVRQQLQAENASIIHLISTKQKNLNYLVVDDEHRLLYCFVPKVASTNWLKFLVIL